MSLQSQCIQNQNSLPVTTLSYLYYPLPFLPYPHGYIDAVILLSLLHTTPHAIVNIPTFTMFSHRVRHLWCDSSVTLSRTASSQCSHCHNVPYLPDVILQALHPVQPQHKPYLQGTESAAQRNLPMLEVHEKVHECQYCIIAILIYACYKISIAR